MPIETKKFKKTLTIKNIKPCNIIKILFIFKKSNDFNNNQANINIQIDLSGFLNQSRSINCSIYSLEQILIDLTPQCQILYNFSLSNTFQYSTCESGNCSKFQSIYFQSINVYFCKLLLQISF